MSQPKKRVLGVDPGLTRCGIGIVEGALGSSVSLVAVGVIRTDSDAPLEQRLLALEVELTAWVNNHQPDVIAVERVFSQHNVRTVMGTAQAAGVALLVAARAEIPVVMHTPSEVKAAVTGSGRANKVQVAEMVKRLLQLREVPKPVDSTDALALAICHLWRGTGNSRISEALKLEKARIGKLAKR
jgi:crossover junction endodeoxyribonuclease RuvC